MSDTDKDKPYRVVAEWWQPWHCRCPDRHHNPPGPPYSWPHPIDRECQLPPEPVVADYAGYAYRECHWAPVWPHRGHEAYRRPYTHPPAWFRRHAWWGPQRVATRAEGRRAIAEYRATGEVDTVHNVDQHRHCARRLWA